MRVTASGAVFALGYCGIKISSLIGADAGRPLSGGLATTWAPLSATTGAFLMVVGLTMPSWGSRLSVITEWIRLFRAYTALYPLWRRMYDLLPGIALLQAPTPHPSWRTRWAVRDLRLRVYRRIIEIHDGRLALRGYCDARVSAAARRRGAAAGLTGLRLHALQEATVLTAAIHARRIDKKPPDVATELPERPGGGLGEDIVWYSSVAAVLGSPLIVDTFDDVDPVIST
jgi:hypothetical protein